jgi:3',5'-cyclic AMP phosphodiesterase CpdA
MRILHLTDTHLHGDPAARHYDRIDTAAALRGLLARLGALQDIDAVVHTGDASEDGTAESYRLLHEILDPFAAALDAPLAVVMGNHDVSAVYGEHIAAGERTAASQDRVVPLAGGGRVVVLDSSGPWRCPA